MERMGHSSPRAALIYLHATRERDERIAAGMGKLLKDGYTGARIQSRMPDVLIRRLVGVLVMAIGAYYLSSGLG